MPASQSYDLGVVLLEKGQAAEAKACLELASTKMPDNLGVQLDLARVQFSLGEYTDASTQFHKLHQANPPEDALVIINQYLAILRTQDRYFSNKLGGYIEGSFGHDDNPTGLAKLGQFVVPAFGNASFNNAGASKPAPSSFSQVAMGYATLKELTPESIVAIQADTSFRHYAQTSDIDRGFVHLNAKLMHKMNSDLASLGITQMWITKESNKEYSMSALTGEWSFGFANEFAPYVFAQLAKMNYYEPVPVPNTSTSNENYGQRTVGAGFNWNMSENTRSMVGVYAEHQYGTDRLDGSSSGWGTRIGVQHKLSQNLTSQVFAGYKESSYSDENAYFLRNRKDTITDITAELRYAIAPDVILKGSYSYRDQRSNIPWQDNTRNLFELAVRYEF